MGKLALKVFRVESCLLLLFFAFFFFGFYNPASHIDANSPVEIKILPSLSQPSVKNGQKLTISALVTSTYPIASVRAKIAEDNSDNILELLSLKTQPGSGSDPHNGFYQVEWLAHGLEETTYQVTILVKDSQGNTQEDSSLTFTDPTLGVTSAGNTSYPDGGLERITGLTLSDESEGWARTAVIDVSGGFAYFGTYNNPGKVVKIQLSDFTRVGSLTLETGERPLSSVIDTSGGFAYFGTGGFPGEVVKVQLSDFTRMGALTLNSGENELKTATIDTSGGFAYFGTYTSPGIVVKVQLSDFTRVGALTLNSGENYLLSATIDVSGGFAYFGGYTAPGIVVKVQLSDFTRVGALTLNSGENYLQTATIDTSGGFAYFGTLTSPGRVVKIQLSDFTRVGVLTLNSGENSLYSSTIDTTNGFAYFGTYTSPGKVVKVQLSDFTRVGVLTLNSGENSLYSSVIDVSGGFTYYGTDNSTSFIIKVQLSDFTRSSLLILTAEEEDARTAVIDVSGGFAYFGTNTVPGKVVKIQLSDFTRVGSLSLNPSENYPHSSVIDTTNGFAYFGTDTDPGKVVKIQLSDFTRVGSLTLETGENALYSSVIDTTNGFAYFGTNTSPGIIVKIQLSDFTRVATLTINTGENQLRSAVIDTTNGFAYFGTRTSPGKVIKIQLSDFTRVGVLTLNSGEDDLRAAAVIDVSGGFAYFGTYTSPGKVVKVQLSDFTRVGALTLNSGENSLWSDAVIDTTNGFAYFGTSTNPGIVVKVQLSDFTRVGAITLNAGEQSLRSAVIDTLGGFAYFGASTNPGIITKIGLTNKGFIKAAKATLSETASSVTSFSFYSHASGGNIRLGLFDSSKNKLWESASVSNTASGDWLTVNVSDGTPTSLTDLAAGTYYLAYQIDSGANIPSYTAGSAGDGFYLTQSYGAFPSSISGDTSSSEKWSLYMTYVVNASPDAPSTLGPSALVGGSWGNDNTPTLTFTLSDSDTSDTVQSRVQIDDSSGFSSAAVDYTSALAAQGSTSFTVGQAAGSGSYVAGSEGQTLSDGSYYWRVKAIDNSSAESSWSTANSGSIASKIDTVIPSSFELISPGGESYTGSNRPTFRWKAASTPDSDSGLPKYKIWIDNGDDNDFLIDSIPATRTTDYETTRYLTHYEGFDDSDTTNNYISIYTKSSSDWPDDQNDGKLKEGRREWKVTAVDNAGNEQEHSRTLLVDQTDPSVSIAQINNLPFVDNSVTTNRTPTIYGKVVDPLTDYNGDNSESKVASGPKEAEIKIEKEQAFGGYKLHSLATVNFNSNYWSDTGDLITNNTQNRADKYAPLFYAPSKKLTRGTYKITLTGQDKAENHGFSKSFGLNIVSPEEKSLLEKAKEMIEEKVEELIPPIPSDEEEFSTSSFLGNIISFINKAFYFGKEVAISGFQATFEGIKKPKEFLSRIGDWLSYSGAVFGEIVLDKEPTKIMEVEVIQVSSNGATITWTTNHHTKNNKVNYGEDKSYGNEAWSQDREIYHQVTLKNLKPGTKYYFEVMSQNKNYVYDANREFTTLQVEPDVKEEDQG